MSIPNSIKLRHESLDKQLPDPAIQYIVELGGQTNQIFPFIFPPSIIFNPTI